MLKYISNIRDISMDIYREKLLDHYNNPRNYGKLADPDAVSELSNISCGDVIKMQLKTKEGRVQQVMFEGEGCAVSIASASMLTEYVSGMELEKVMELDLERFLDILGIELTMSRIKCANLCLETLKQCTAQTIANNSK